jgi:hypothetical protein
VRISSECELKAGWEAAILGSTEIGKSESGIEAGSLGATTTTVAKSMETGGEFFSAVREKAAISIRACRLRGELAGGEFRRFSGGENNSQASETEILLFPEI